jgi:GTPase
MAKKFYVEEKPKVLIVGLITPQNIHIDSDEYINEFKNLVESNDIEYNAEYFGKLREIDAGTFITKGKLEDIKKVCVENSIDHVIFSEQFSPHQETMLQKALNAKIFDRTDLIIDIFEKRARSAEAKLQVKIAYLEHKKTRVAGRGKSFSQQSGGFGSGRRGPGETKKESDLQYINTLLHKLKNDLKELEQIRKTQRKKRVKNKCFQISLIGYTNAGKSTIFNKLTKSCVLAQDKLFATLDTTTRTCFFDDKKVVVSDTVGFIQNLPIQLIKAFHSTLEELQYADLILHVVDISNKNWRQHIEVANEIIEKLCLVDKKRMFVANKIDLLNEKELESLKENFPNKECIFVSAKDEDISTINRSWLF